MSSSPEKIVVLPDLHGREDLLRAGLNSYKKYMPVFLGDYVNGQPFEKEVINIVRDHTDTEVGNALLGNHEIHLLTVLNSAKNIESGSGDIEASAMAIDMWSRARSIGTSILRSYGVDMRLYRQPQSRLLRLYELMNAEGHVDFLASLPLLYDGESLAAVHAGFTDEPLSQQKKDLADAKKVLLGGEIGVEPPQLFSHDLARIRVGYNCTDKVVVTGHTSFSEDETTRVSDDGRHVRLGSPVKSELNKTMYVYLSQEAQVRSVQAA